MEHVKRRRALSEDVSDNELGNFDSGIEHAEDKDDGSSMGPDVNHAIEGQLSSQADTRTPTLDLDDEGEDAIHQFKKGTVSQEMIDSVKENIRRFKAKGYCNLNEDEAGELSNNFKFLAQLGTHPHFTDRALALAEQIPSQIQRVSQIKKAFIENPNRKEDEIRIIAEIENEMQARLVEIRQLDETAEIITRERAQRVELKEELLTRMWDMCHKVNKASTALAYLPPRRRT